MQSNQMKRWYKSVALRTRNALSEVEIVRVIQGSAADRTESSITGAVDR